MNHATDVGGSGVMVPPIEEATVQKYDMQFGTNVVGTWIVDRELPYSVDSIHCRSLVIHNSLVACALCGHRCVTHPRESAYRDGVVIGKLSHQRARL